MIVVAAENHIGTFLNVISQTWNKNEYFASAPTFLNGEESLLDCLIVGGGVAGSMAAVYLARFQRSALIVEADHSRLAMIAKSRNVLGFPDGATGADLLERLCTHSSKYGIQREAGCVDGVARLPDGGFEVSAGSLRWQSSTVLLATVREIIRPL